MKYEKINGHTFEVIKSAKKADELYARTYRERFTRLEDCYKKASAAKWTAYNFWREFMRDMYFNGFEDYTVEQWAIIGHNCDTFSIGAIVTNFDTGEIVGVMHITHANNYFYKF